MKSGKYILQIFFRKPRRLRNIQPCFIMLKQHASSRFIMSHDTQYYTNIIPKDLTLEFMLLSPPLLLCLLFFPPSSKSKASDPFPVVVPFKCLASNSTDLLISDPETCQPATSKRSRYFGFRESVAGQIKHQPTGT